MAQAKESLLLHIHDFAEDGRPKLSQPVKWLSEQSPSSSPYLTASHIHYAAPNGRDLSILQLAGIPAEHLHLLPNPITGPSSTTSDFQAPENPAFLNQFSEVTLYPARGIRRKNLGEFVLWSTQCSKALCLR